MLGIVGPDLNSQCEASFWFRLFHPECLGTGNSLTGDSIPQISASIVNTPPAAPQTAAAMKVPGVWTPDYAMQRTWADVIENQDAEAAAAEARNGTGRYQDYVGLPFGDPNEPDVNACDSGLYSVFHPSDCLGIDPIYLYVGAGVLAYAVLR
jgi:hypothetical protein